jgi:hypothetical protein
MFYKGFAPVSPLHGHAFLEKRVVEGLHCSSAWTPEVYNDISLESVI